MMSLEKAELNVRKNGCSSHGCRILALAGLKQKGMATNGPCLCLRDDFTSGGGWVRIQQITNSILTYQKVKAKATGEGVAT